MDNIISVSTEDFNKIIKSSLVEREDYISDNEPIRKRLNGAIRRVISVGELNFVEIIE